MTVKKYTNLTVIFFIRCNEGNAKSIILFHFCFFPLIGMLQTEFGATKTTGETISLFYS